MSKEITVLSTFAHDKLVNLQGEVLSEGDGGPALFIKKVFEEQDISYNLLSGETVNVEILKTAEGEFGKVPVVPVKQGIDISLLASWTLISTLLDEWDLAGLIGYKGKVFLDIQGYVRQGSDFGKKRSFNVDPLILKNVYCMKGTREEISYLSPEVMDEQSRRMILITDGSEGLEVISQEKSYKYPVLDKVEAKDTLGAGDTLLANFVLGLNQGLEINQSIVRSMTNVSIFLSKKSI